MPGYGGKSYRRRAPVRAAVKPVTNRTRRKAVTTVKAKRFRTAVKSVMARQLETKRISTVLANETAINGGGLDNNPNFTLQNGFCQPDVMAALDVVRGTASNNRIGDRITPTSIYLTGMVFTNAFDTVSNIMFRPFTVRILVFRHVEGFDLPQNIEIKKNDATNPPTYERISGRPLQEMMPYNSKYKVLASR